MLLQKREAGEGTAPRLPDRINLAGMGANVYNVFMKRAQLLTEAQILEELIADNRSTFGVEAARSLLSLRFSRATTARISSLLRANNKGKLSAAQRLELEKYLRVGQLLDLLQAKARASLASRKAA